MWLLVVIFFNASDQAPSYSIVSYDNIFSCQAAEPQAMASYQSAGWDMVFTGCSELKPLN